MPLPLVALFYPYFWKRRLFFTGNSPVCANKFVPAKYRTRETEIVIVYANLNLHGSEIFVMIQPKLNYVLHEEGLLSPPAKRQKISLCPSPISPFSPYQEYSEANNSYHVAESVEVPFTIKWNQHPEDCVAFPTPPNLNNYQFSDAQSEEHISHSLSSQETVSFSCVHRCICCLCPKPSSTPFSDLLKSMPPVETSHAEDMLAPFPDPFPELSLETVVSILSSCAQTGHVPTSSYQPEDHRKVTSSLTVEGPFNSSWYIGGLTALTSFPEIKSSIECLMSRCRRDSDINARFTLIMENQYRSTVGEQIKGKLWDVTPEKISVDLFGQLSKFSAYLQGEGLFVKMTVYLQDPAVKLLSDNDVKKKRSVITIYEKEDASLIYAFYVAVRRNIIFKQKKATSDAKKKKELENQLTNVYRKGRKSLKKKTQSVLDKSKVLKTVDDSWGFSDIPLLEMKLGVRCVVFSSFGKCLYEGGYEFQNNEIDLLYINNKFHVLASRNVFRNYNPAQLKMEPCD